MAVNPKSSVAGVDEPAIEEVPQHVCIIMDGNHRWARERRMPGAAGHRAGAQQLRHIAEACADIGVKSLTLFAFSTENWQRPKGEVRLLMDLMRHVMDNDLDELNRRDVRLRVIGDRDRFADDIKAKMLECEALTANNQSLDLSVAVNFGGRWDIVRAAQQLAERARSGALDPSSIDEETFAAQTSLGDLPNPDLLIRTGGDHRISNFLLWDLAYTELYFTDVYWPDFNRECLCEAVRVFASRARRFGRRT